MAGNNTNKGFLSLEAQDRSARRRLLVGLVVGAVTFGLGVGVVAALKSPLDPSAQAAAAPPPSPDEAPAPAARPPAGAEEPDEADDAPAEEPPPPEPEQDQAADEGDSPGEEPDDGDLADGEAPEEDEAEGDTDDDSDDTDAVAAKDDAEDKEAEAPSGDWWSGLRDKRTRLDFNGQPRLIMREGELHRDETTTYGPFLDNPIALRIRKTRAPVVVPHHFGIHPQTEEPCLVYATVTQGDLEARGILPLLIGDTQLTLSPLKEGEAP